MFHIQQFKVKNFKAFRESPMVELKPLTVFSGVNSSGKSSFIQGLLLLKQSLETEIFPRLRLAGSKPGELYVEFSPFSEAVFKYAPSEDNQLEFEIQVDGRMPESAARKFFKGELPDPIANPENSQVTDLPLSLFANIRFCYKEEWGAIVDRLECETFCGDAVGPCLMVVFSPNGKDQITFSSITSDWRIEWEDVLDFQWRGILPHGFVISRDLGSAPKSEKLPREAVERIAGELGVIFRPLGWLAEELENNFYYLESLRPRPRSMYVVDPNPPLAISAQGELPFQKLWYDKEKQFKTIVHGYEIEEKDLVDAANRILDSLGIKQLLSISPEGSLGFQIRFQTVDGKDSVSIPHVGFGISQILPIILICLESKEGDTIIIDHPEIHLHPNAQALLADYFIKLIKSGRRLIVETHSQYFINRLIRRSAEEEGLADKINVLFVRPQRGEEGATIAQLEINEDGDISNWPPDFFPEPDEDIAQTLTAKFRRGQQ
jgi:predicted ATPase